MYLIDTHTHIYYHKGPELDEQIERCQQQHVGRLFLPNVDVESVDAVFETCDRHPAVCYPMLGLHPTSVKEDYQAALNAIESRLDERKIYAIGEIGTDLYWDKSTLAWQQDAFRQQVGWAKQRNLPIVIHCRDAFDEQFELLDELNDEKLFGIFHCFTGNVEQAKRAIDLGFMLGIGGVLTFKNSGLDHVVQELPLEQLVLETDAPYLAPVPYRGKPNQSSYLPLIADKLADLLGIGREEVAEQTTDNARRVFGLKKS